MARKQGNWYTRRTTLLRTPRYGRRVADLFFSLPISSAIACAPPWNFLEQPDPALPPLWFARAPHKDQVFSSPRVRNRPVMTTIPIFYYQFNSSRVHLWRLLIGSHQPLAGVCVLGPWPHTAYHFSSISSSFFYRCPVLPQIVILL